MTSIRDALEGLHSRHVELISANYHLSNPRLIQERQELMKSETRSSVWVEATPSYVSGEEYDKTGIPREVVDLFRELQQTGLMFRVPYLHQSEALKEFFVNGKNLVISTGTGSGKTEIFLYSILGLMALEAKRAKTTQMRGIRSIILYPMNALVADQLARVRRLFGSASGAASLEKRYDRRIQFGMYTSRTQYHGLYDPDRNKYRIKPIVDYFNNLEQSNPTLYKSLREKGRVPAKDLRSFAEGRRGGDRYRTQPSDTELLTRQEMHHPNEYGGAPDILITNYSMLEYMLLRPIEQPLFESTRSWLKSDPENQLLVVVDEAHLYRGAQGAEVGMLIRRLLQHLNADANQVRFILSSASLGSRDLAREYGPSFASQLTSCDQSRFVTITSTRVELEEPGSHSSDVLIDVMSGIGQRHDRDAIQHLSQTLGWEKPDSVNDHVLMEYLGTHLKDLPEFRHLYNVVTSGPIELESLAGEVFPNHPVEISVDAILNMMHLGSQAIRVRDERLLPARLHILFKGLPRQYVCLNPDCSERKAIDKNHRLLGRLYVEPRFQCECGSRVFELLSHRTCGAAYIRAFRKSSDQNSDHVFLWDDAPSEHGFDELHILVEEPRSDPDLEHPQNVPLIAQLKASWINIHTGHIQNNEPSTPRDFIKVWVPRQPSSQSAGSAWSWARCPACGIREKPRRGMTKIMDLETKGEEPFANLVKTQFQFQPAVIGHEGFPNKGRKVLCFSDGRQKAARMARDLQRIVEMDSFRELIVDVVSSKGDQGSLETLFPGFVSKTTEYNIGFFDDEDSVIGYVGSRRALSGIQNGLPQIAAQYGASLQDAATDVNVASHLNRRRPYQYDAYLLRLLGDRNFSIRATMLGYLEPSADVMDSLAEMNQRVDRQLLREIIVEILAEAAEERAYDPAIHGDQRRESRATMAYPEGWSRDGGECLAIDELIPVSVFSRLQGDVSEGDWQTLRVSLVRKGRNGRTPRLFETSDNGRYVVNPDAVRLHLGLSESWLRCSGCRQFTPIGIRGRCVACGGHLEEVTEDDPHLVARKSLLRKPCLDVLEGRHRPFTLRSEEHSAQISNKDVSEVFSRSENYELLFQDIIVEDGVEKQPIDVLSCTTTMEVGIDIGDLTGVALRTIPPLPSNYQQRAGRAGRRGSALSTIITFADNSPHETYSFFNPGTIIGAEPAKPTIYVGNRKIAERHINASLIQRFFQSAEIHETANVFSSLGSTATFFRGDGDYSLPAFVKWVEKDVLPATSQVTSEIGGLLPGALASPDGTEPSTWREDFVRATAELLIKRLNDLANTEDLEEAETEDDNLLGTLLEAAILPSFSFPIDVCSFSVRELDRQANRVVTRYEPALELQQALSEYAPGRQIVIDKKTFESYGLHFPFPSDIKDRASDQDWDRCDWLNFCPSCDSVMAEKKSDLSSGSAICEVCQSPLQSLRIFRPMGFSPEVDSNQQRPREGQRLEPKRVYATSAKLPVPIGGRAVYNEESAFRTVRGRFYSLRDQGLLVTNRGRDDRGFEVCTLCGAIGGSSGLANPHNRPYPRDPRINPRLWQSRCGGPSVQIALGHEFRTDLAIMRMDARRPFDFAFNARWMQDAYRSLSEALVISATRTMEIDSDELHGGVRILPKLSDDPDDLLGYIEFFFYDTTPGGAGFASMAYESFEEILDDCLELLGDCTCSQSCQACLRSFHNRYMHNSLDRHLAFSLLSYVKTGQIPPVDTRRAEQILQRLSRSLTLMEPKMRIVTLNPDAYELEVAVQDARLKIRLRSCMESAPDDQGAVLQITDYETIHELPAVASRIKQRLVGVRRTNAGRG